MVNTYLCSSMKLLVSNNLNPAMFSTARLLKNPTNPVAKPIRSANAHLSTTYWKIWTLFRDLQSSLNKSFSTILKRVDSKEKLELYYKLKSLRLKNSMGGEGVGTRSPSSRWGRCWRRRWRSARWCWRRCASWARAPESLSPCRRKSSTSSSPSPWESL